MAGISKANKDEKQQKAIHEINRLFSSWNSLKREYTLWQSASTEFESLKHKANFLDLMFSSELSIRSVQNVVRALVETEED